MLRLRIAILPLFAACVFSNNALAQQSAAISTPDQPDKPQAPAKKATAKADAWVGLMTKCFADFDACLTVCRTGEESACSYARMMANGRFHAENPEIYRELALADCAGNAPGCFLSAWHLHYDSGKRRGWRADLVRDMMRLACDHEVKEACPLAKDADDFPRFSGNGKWPEPPETVKSAVPPEPACTSTPVDTSLIYLESEVNVHAKLLSRVDPRYPEEMRRKSQEGEVALVAVVDENGTVTGIGKLGGAGRAFLDAGAAAVLHWKYQPAQKCGVPVSVVKMVTVIFTLH